MHDPQTHSERPPSPELSQFLQLFSIIKRSSWKKEELLSARLKITRAHQLLIANLLKILQEFTTYKPLGSTHAFSEEQQRFILSHIACKLRAIARSLYFAAMFTLPLRQIWRSVKSIVKAALANVCFSREKCGKIAFKIVHL